MSKRGLWVGSCLSMMVFACLFPTSAWAKCQDRDGDGYLGTAQCGSRTDCNDNDTSVHPGAQELCDNKDNNCNGIVDDVGTITCGTGVCRHTIQSCIAGITQVV